MSGPEIPGLRLLRQTGFSQPHDPAFPFKLVLNFSPPEFMVMTFVLLYGGSEVIEVQGMTLEALQEFITRNNFRTHPRLRHLTITGPEGEIEKCTCRAANEAP